MDRERPPHGRRDRGQAHPGLPHPAAGAADAGATRSADDPAPHLPQPPAAPVRAPARRAPGGGGGQGLTGQDVGVSDIDELLAGNAAYAPSHPGGLPAPPSRRVAVVTCMDARIDVYAALGLRPGEAHVIRNAGGIVTDDVIRSLAISQRKLGTRDVLVVHHTKCGMLGLDDEAFLAELAEAAGGTAPSWQPGGFDDLEADVRRSVERLRASGYLSGGGEVRGFLFDV